jgi:hypothetical protein
MELASFHSSLAEIFVVAGRYRKVFTPLYYAVSEKLGNREAMIRPNATEERGAKVHRFDSL